MLIRQKNVAVQLNFADRVYRLGESIDVIALLKAKRSANVRKAELRLTCVESYSSEYSAQVFERPGEMMSGSGDHSVVFAPTETYKSIRKGVSKYRKIVLADEIILGSDFSLRAGQTKNFHLNFPIRLSLPSGHVFEDALLWELALWLDIRWSSDIYERKPVRIITYLSKVKPLTLAD